MRLRRLDLTRYGKFTDERIDFGVAAAGVPDLHIVYGLNEAGKSTALSAYLDLLFGIEERSRYNFLHPYPSMQIGARLEWGGHEHDLVRVKQRTNSLLDARGQPLNEALLSVPLAGLTREAYRTMFSLDDETLEEGGNAIIASKGDLGELLFSASAGLADLGTTLAAVKDDADKIYKRLGRSTDIAEFKKQLVQLKAERDGIDTLASAHAGLVAASTQAEAAYAAAVEERAAAKARQDEMGRILRAMPLAAQYRRLVDRLEAAGPLPVPPPGWAAQLPALMTRTTQLSTEITLTGADMERLAAEIAAVAIDAPVLALADRIAGLAEGMARFSTAQTDLPKRHAAMDDHEAAIAAILLGLGQKGHGAPHDLVLAAPVVGRLRDLIEARSGLEARSAAALRELAAAKSSLERASAERDDIAGRDGAVDAAALAGIDAALGVLRRSDHQARLQLAERSRTTLQRRWTAQRDSLLPWQGDGEALSAMTLPGQRQLDLWRSKAVAIAGRRAGYEEKRREGMTRQREDEARIAAIRAIAGAIEDAEATRLRKARDAAWAAHGLTLDPQSAKTFAQALEDDDALAARRLAHAQDLAALRVLQHSVAVNTATLSGYAQSLGEADAELAALAAEIGAALPAGVQLLTGEDVTGWVEQIEGWARRRQDALVAWAALSETEDDLAAAKTGLARDLADLAQAMTLAGFPDAEDLSPHGLMQAAETALAQGGTQQVSLAAAERTLRDRARDLTAREADLAEARQAEADWQAAWQAGLAATWFADEAIGAVRATLDALADLPAALGARDELARRIDTMRRDQDAFVAAVAAIAGELGEALDPLAALDAAQRLNGRLEQAQQAQRNVSQKEGEHQRLADILRQLRQDLSGFAARKDEMTTFFGVETLEAMTLALDQAADQARLRGQIETLAGQIAGELRADTIAAALEQLAAIDEEEAEKEAASLEARLDDGEERSKHLFAERSRAADRLDAIGGDAAVARIESQRRTVLLQIEDRAMRYLRLKTGALVAEKALRAYRETHRSSMMNRASDAFALITRGDYSGLAARPEKDRETLIGLPRQGGSRLAADMSKGTQFQLYLALRLAGYQEFARARPSVPFVADDIMETFDEPRSEEVFRLLGEMARIGQVIYLTHHRHLCDIARLVVPNVRVHELAGAMVQP